MGELMTKYMWYERHKEVVGDAKKYMNDITLRYKRTYGYYLFKNHRRNLSSTGSSQALMLEQRKWESYNRPLISGIIHILGGNDTKKWQRVYCVLQPNYIIDVYSSEKDFEAANRPRLSLQHGIYNVVENVDGHFTQLIKDYLRDFGFVVENVSQVAHKVGSVTDPSRRPTQHVLSLYHKYRGSYYMAFDSALEKDKWLEYLNEAQRQLVGVHCDDATKRDAFESAVKQICDAEEHCNLQVKIAGNQEEIITDFLTAYLSNGCKAMLKTKVKGDVVKKFKMWSAISKGLSDTVEAILNEEFPALRKNAETDVEAQQQQMISAMAQINSSYDSASGTVVDDLGCSWHDELDGRILPSIPNIVERLQASMLIPVAEVENIFLLLMQGVENHLSATSTEFANNIDRYFLDHLDVAPRTPETMRNVFNVCSGSKSVLSVLSELFPKYSLSEFEGKLCKLMQRLLDSAILTFEVLCGEAVSKSGGRLEKTTVGNIKARVLKRYTHDSALITKRFIYDVLNDAVYKTLKPIAYQDIKNKMHRYEEMIPQEYAKFLLANCVFDDTIREKLRSTLSEHISASWNQSSPVNGTEVKESSHNGNITQPPEKSEPPSQDDRVIALEPQQEISDEDQSPNEDILANQMPSASLTQDDETGECVEDNEVTEKPSEVTNEPKNETDTENHVDTSITVASVHEINEPSTDNSSDNKEGNGIRFEDNSSEMSSKNDITVVEPSADKICQDETGVTVQSPANVNVHSDEVSERQSCTEITPPCDLENGESLPRNDSLQVNGHEEGSL